MNKIVLRGLIVMVSLVFGLMVAGCDPEPNGNVDPSGGKTVEAKYWGNYATTWQGGSTVTLSEKKLVSTASGTEKEFQAWTDGVNLYTYYDEVVHYGVFTNDTTFHREGTPDWIYTKTDN